jgi:hypothetical protein
MSSPRKVRGLGLFNREFLFRVDSGGFALRICFAK